MTGKRLPSGGSSDGAAIGGCARRSVRRCVSIGSCGQFGTEPVSPSRPTTTRGRRPQMEPHPAADALGQFENLRVVRHRGDQITLGVKVDGSLGTQNADDDPDWQRD